MSLSCAFSSRQWNIGLVSSGVSLISWGESASLALVRYPSSDDITIKILYGAEFFLLGWSKMYQILLDQSRLVLGRSTPMVVLAFSGLTCHLGNTWVFSGCTVLPDSKDTKLESSIHPRGFSISMQKNRIVLAPCRTCGPTAISGGADISKGLECHLLQQDEFSVRVAKLTSRIGVSWTYSLPFCF